MYNMTTSVRTPNQCGNSCIDRCDIFHCDSPCKNLLKTTNDYVLIFGKGLQLDCLSRACVGTLRDGVRLEQLIGWDFFFFVPDLEEVGSHSYFENVSPGVVYKSGNYVLKAPVNKEAMFSEIKVIKFENQTIIVGKDITKQKQFLNADKAREERLNRLTQECRNLKTALDVVVDSAKQKQDQAEKNCRRNIEELVFPILDILKSASLTEHQKTIIDILEANLQTITDSFSQVASDKYELTNREKQVANFIRTGKTTKQISEILHLSCRTVDYHRMNIRKKLDISNTGYDLRSQLLAFSENDSCAKG